MVSNSSLNQTGIINRTNYTCHQLEAPEIPEATNPHIPQQTTDSTFQLPIGDFSALSELRLGNMKAAETLLSTVLHYRSNWSTGKTWKSALRELSKLTGLSVRYIRKVLSDLMGKDWVERLSRGTNTGSTYHVKHYNCGRSMIPTDKNGNPLKIAIPQGKGGILERLFNGDISWKAALIWIILKLNSDWKTGITIAMSIEAIRKWAGMSPKTVSDCLKELAEAGLLKRISKPHEAGVYQLYPKPDDKPKPRFRPKREKLPNSNRSLRIDGDWRWSFNGLWRINIETGNIQTRKSTKTGLWRGLTLGDTIPKPIQRDFDDLFQFAKNLRAGLVASNKS